MENLIQTYPCSKCGFINLQPGPCWKCKGKKHPLLLENNTDLESNSDCIYIDFKDSEIIEYCPWGLGHPYSCKECDFYNCSKSREFKLKSYFLKRRKLNESS